MQNLVPNKQAKKVFATHAPAANTAAVITLAAAEGVTHVLDRLWWSLAGTLGAAVTLTVAIGGVTRWQVTISAVDHGEFQLDGLHGEPGDEVVITLPAGGASCTGKINASYR